jgi:hypothetical protein
MAASRFRRYKAWRQPDKHGINYRVEILTINFAEYFSFIFINWAGVDVLDPAVV